MTSIEEAERWIGRTAVDNAGEQIGIVTQIWVDDASGEPEWASVRGSALRGQEVLVPLAGASSFGGGRRFGYSKEDIFDAPPCGRDGRLEIEDKERLSSYYGAPDDHPDPGSDNWIDRLEVARDGGTVQEIRGLLGDDHSAPPAEFPAAKKGRRLFGRKDAPSAPKPKLKRGFRKKSAPDRQPAELSEQHDEASVGH